MKLGFNLGVKIPRGFTLQRLADSILRSFGPDAHSYPFSTLEGAYQTSAGPAALVVTDPIGLELDAMGVVGVGVELITNGDFSDGSTGWNLSAQWSVSAGAAHRSGVGWGTLTRPGTCSAGKMYKIEGDVVYTSGLLQIYGCEGDQVLINEGGHFVGWMTAGAIGGNFNVGSSDFVGSVTNISVKEVTGNHATQTTAINRPTVQQDGNGRFYASFNGTNQSLVLSSVPFQMADDFAVVVCFTPTGNGAVLDLSGNPIGQQVGGLSVSGGNLFAVFQDDSATHLDLPGGAVAFGVPMVVTVWQRSGVRAIRVNGAQVGGTNSTAFGATTVTLSKIGVNTWNGNFFHGAIYDLIPIKGTVTDAQLLILEKAAAQRAGLVI